MANHDQVALEAATRAVGFLGFGLYPHSRFIHIDLGPARQWGEPFPARAIPFAAENPPAREALALSRTLKATGAAGVAAVGATGVEVAQRALAEALGAVLPLVPHLDTCAGSSSRWHREGSRWLSGRASITGRRAYADVGKPPSRAPRPALCATGDGHRPRLPRHHPVHPQTSPHGRARRSRRSQTTPSCATKREPAQEGSLEPRSKSWRDYGHAVFLAR